MKVRVVDLETTGRPEDDDARICEIGYVDLDLETMEIGNPQTMLIDPGVPMPAAASATHYLVDSDLAGQEHVLAAWMLLNDGLEADDILCAHLARFERHFLPAPNRWICTYKCAVRAWQDAPAHGNSFLRFWLKLDLDRSRAEPAHRALPDAYVTAHILKTLVGMRPVERLIEITGEPVIKKVINFGKHNGTKWAEVQIDYLDWIINKPNTLDDETKEMAAYWLAKRMAAQTAPAPATEA